MLAVGQRIQDANVGCRIWDADTGWSVLDVEAGCEMEFMMQIWGLG